MSMYWGSIEGANCYGNERNVLDLQQQLHNVPTQIIYECAITGFDEPRYNGEFNAEVINVHAPPSADVEALTITKFQQIRWSDISGPYGTFVQSLYKLIPCNNITCHVWVRFDTDKAPNWPESFDGTVTREIVQYLRRDSSDARFYAYGVYDIYVPEAWRNVTASSTAGLMALHHVSLSNGVIRRVVERATNQFESSLRDQSDQWNEQYTLRPHQQQALQWMRHCELHKTFNIPTTLQIGGNHLDVSNNGTLHGSHSIVIHKDPRFNTYTQKGGILTNTVGSGKTAVALALCCAAPPPLGNDEETMPCRGALVIVNINLLAQWKAEISKFWNNAKVVVVKTIVQYRKIQSSELQEADFVLTTFNFYKSPKYVDNLRQKLRVIDLEVPANHMSTLTMRQFMALYGKRNYDSMPPFESLSFQRVIVDEVHEVRTALPRDGFKSLSTLQARSFWGLSGTWQPHTISDFKQFSELYFDCSSCYTAFTEADILTLWQHYAKSFPVPQLPPVEQHYYEITLTRAEMSLQQACRENTDAVALATCYNGGSLSNTVNDVITFESISAIYERMLDVLQSGVERNTHTLANARRIRDTMLTAPDEYTVSEMRNITYRIDQTDDRLQADTQRMNFLQNASATAEGDIQCPICMGAEADTVTQCGHVFCHMCVSQVMKRRMRCPMCKEVLVNTQLATVATRNVPQEGTKLQTFIANLQDIASTGEQVVAFVQWTTLCKAVMSAFNMRHVNAACLRGNESCRAVTLRQFREGSISVLLLSMETSNAGIDLSIANHVVFLHPVVAPSRKEALEMRHQAIARVHRIGQPRQVHVHHYVCKNTVEETLYTEQMQNIVY